MSGRSQLAAALLFLAIGLGAREFAFLAGYNVVGVTAADTGVGTAAKLLAWAPNATAVWHYAADAQQWRVYSATGGDDFRIEPGMACLVACDAPGNASLDGLPALAVHHPLGAGYNFVCAPVATTAAALTVEFQAVWRWDGAAQRWRGYLAGFGGDDFAVAPGDGLLIAAAAPAVWPAYTVGDLVERGIDGAALGIDPKANPYDPVEVAVDVDIVLPGGEAIRQPAFWYTPMARWVQDNGYERFAAVGEGEWRFRFAPSAPGDYTWSWRVGDTVVPGGGFTVATGQTPRGPVAVAAHGRGFVSPDGSPWIPIGENTGWPDEAGAADFATWLPEIAPAGGNCGRLWLTPFYSGTRLEWGSDYANDGYLGAGHYSQESAARLDRIFALAAANDIQLIVSLCSHAETRDDPGDEDWSGHPYNVAKGGWLTNPGQLWTDARAKQYFRARVRYLVARYGWSAHLWAWEFWNEMDLTVGYNAAAAVAWHGEMAAYLRNVDRGRHLLTSSYTWVAGGNYDVFALPHIDFTQIHVYEPDLIPALRTYLDQIDGFGKPALLGEAGLHWTDAYTNEDVAGLNVHDMLWTGVMAGAAGGAMTWWWDNYVHPRDLYYHFTGIGKFIAGLDPPAGTAVPIQVDDPAPWFALARRCDDTVIGWFGPARPTSPYTAATAVDLAGVSLTGDFSGPHAVQWIDPYDGVVVARAEAAGDATGITLTPPTFDHDLAFRLDGPTLPDGDTPLHRRFTAASKAAPPPSDKALPRPRYWPYH